MTATAPPSDPKLERLVLSAWIADANFRQAWQPEPELFFDSSTHPIAEVFRDVYPAKRWNEVNTIAELDKRGKLGSAGGREHVLHTLQAPALANPLAEIDRLRELHGLRCLRMHMHEIAAAVATGKRLHEVQALMRDAVEASVSAVGMPLLTSRDARQHLIDYFAQRGPIEFCTTGVRRLDNLLGGLQRRRVWVFGAPTSWGKSSWTTAMIDENVKRGKRVLLVTAEDDPESYSHRWACRRARVSADAFQKRKLNPLEIQRVVDVANSLPDGLFVLDAVGGVPAERIAGQIRAAVAANKIDLVLVDYAQAVATETDFGAKRNLQVAHIGLVVTNAIKSTRRASGVIWSQVTEDQKTGKFHLRDSLDLAHKAEGVVIGNYGESGDRYVRIAKVKFGPGAGKMSPLEWNKHFAGFESDIPDQLDLEVLTDEEAA